MELNISEGKQIVLFDGVCNLCSSTVIKISKYDTKNRFLFASLQSDIGKQIVDHLKIEVSKTDSIVLYRPTVAYYLKSEAALQIMNGFGGLWKLTQVFTIIPSKISDIVYDFIARHRYKWFGKKESCMIPTPELKAKFLDPLEQKV
ncbi:MAG: DUF393 domain-containing protein [Flavobacteriaceae bacterium]|nr:MAG: DUF393 domain-containing protein [Flavobacteriaceae bacterium]